MKSVYRVFIEWLMTTVAYRFFLMKIVPFIRFTTYYTSLRGWKYRRGESLLRSGHILLSVDRKKLTSLLIPGTFTHASICIEKDDQNEIAEMTHKNFTYSTFFDICKEADRVVILRAREWDGQYINKIVSAVKSLEKSNYDVAFNLSIEALYCSELIYQADKLVGPRLNLDLTDLAGLGRPYLSPDGLFASKSFDIVWDSDREVL